MVAKSIAKIMLFIHKPATRGQLQVIIALCEISRHKTI